MTIGLESSASLAGPWVPLAQSMASGATDWSGGVTTSTVRELPGYLFVWPTMDAGAASAQRFYRLRVTAP